VAHEFHAPGTRFASLVPDVAYLSREAVEALGDAASESPPRAPEIAVEILSAGENERRLAWKIAAYLAAGTRVVFVVDPPRRTVIAHAREGTTRFGPGDVVTHASMPGFAYDVDAMFEGLYLGTNSRLGTKEGTTMARAQALVTAGVLMLASFSASAASAQVAGPAPAGAATKFAFVRTKSPAEPTPSRPVFRTT
jgi:hypothetical protein